MVVMVLDYLPQCYLPYALALALSLVVVVLLCLYKAQRSSSLALGLFFGSGEFFLARLIISFSRETRSH